MRPQRYKLIDYYGEGDYWELFDLQADPDERHNLYGDPRHGATITALKEELGRLRQEYRDGDRAVAGGGASS